MKTLSQVTKYGLRALICLASTPKHGGGYQNIQSISGELQISFHFLTRIFRQLTNEGILRSFRGPSGGVVLAKPAEEIRLIDIVLILEGSGYFDECLLGLPGCGSAKPCPVHDFWKGVKEDIRTHMTTTNLAELVEKVKTNEVRLYDL